MQGVHSKFGAIPTIFVVQPRISSKLFFRIFKKNFPFVIFMFGNAQIQNFTEIRIFFAPPFRGAASRGRNFLKIFTELERAYPKT